MDQSPDLIELQISSLRDRVSDVLNHQSIKSCIKQALLLNGGPTGFDKLQALQQLQVCGVVDEVIKAAAAEVGATEHVINAFQSAEPAGQYGAHMPGAAVQLVPQQQFRPGNHHLHVVVKGGRAFTEYLTRPGLPGEKLQLHLLLQGQRIASAPVEAGTSPAFKTEAIIQLPAAAAATPGARENNCATGVNSPVKSKAARVFAGAAEAATAGSWDGSEQSGSNNSSSSLDPELQHLLQLHERLHVVVVSSTPAQGAAQGSYTEAAATAAATVSAQQRGSTSSLQQQQQRVHQLCCQQLLYGVGALDWRKALSRSKGPYITLVELRPGQPDELQSSVAVGAVELHLQLLSLQQSSNQLMYQQQKQLGALPAHRPTAVGYFTPLPESVVRLQQQCELRAESEALVGFIKRAKAWWAAYLAINPKFKQRNVKVLARCEAGCQHPVAAWVAPLQLGRCLSTAAEAARFAALLGVRQQFESLPGAAAGAGSSDGCWLSLHTCLAAKQASEEELALLLCSLLLGFGLDAWVVNGRQNGNSSSSRGAPASWVLVHEPTAPESSMLWEPCTGLQLGVRDLQSLPFASIDSAFNHRQLLANCQPDSSPAAVNWQLQDTEAWLSLDMSVPALHQPMNKLAFPLHAPSLSPWWLEQQLEQQIMAGLAAAQRQLQQDLQGPVAAAAAGTASSGMLWDTALAHLIMPALAAYETEAVLGAAPPAASQVAIAIRRATPSGYTFKGLPQHHRTLAAPVILDCLLSLAVVREMLLLPWALQQQQQQQQTGVLGLDADRVVYALRVKVTMYPEDLASVWLMFAAKYRTAE